MYRLLIALWSVLPASGLYAQPAAHRMSLDIQTGFIQPLNYPVQAGYTARPSSGYRLMYYRLLFPKLSASVVVGLGFQQHRFLLVQKTSGHNIADSWTIRVEEKNRHDFSSFQCGFSLAVPLGDVWRLRLDNNLLFKVPMTEKVRLSSEYEATLAGGEIIQAGAETNGNTRMHAHLAFLHELFAEYRMGKSTQLIFGLGLQSPFTLDVITSKFLYPNLHTEDPHVSMIAYQVSVGLMFDL